MDEIVSFDGVERLRDANSREEIVRAFVGHDHRYGQSFWHVAWIPSSLLYPLYGEQGQIIGTRMLFSVLLLGTVVLFALKFIQGWGLRFLTITTALVIPQTHYYASMPKPEPLLMLLVIGFACLWQEKEKVLGTSALLLGLAFGTKISIFPAVVIFLFYYLLYQNLANGRRLISLIAGSSVWFLIGFLLAVPIIVYDLSEGLNTYLDFTWRNRGHGADDSSISIATWAAFIETNAFFGLGKTTWFVLATMLLLPWYLLIADTRDNLLGLLKRQNFRENLLVIVTSKYAEPLLLVMTGGILILSIVVSVQRLWGFYLYPGNLLILFGYWLMVSRYLADRPENSKLQIASVGAASLLVLWAALPQLRYTTSEFYILTERSSTPHHILQSKRFDTVMTLTEKYSRERGKRLEVHFSARVWYPRYNEFAIFLPTYGPFKAWHREADLLFFTPDMVPSGDYKPRGTDYDEQLADAWEQLAAHSAHEGVCERSLCYQKVDNLGSDLHVYLKQN